MVPVDNGYKYFAYESVWVTNGEGKPVTVEVTYKGLTEEEAFSI